MKEQLIDTLVCPCLGILSILNSMTTSGSSDAMCPAPGSTTTKEVELDFAKAQLDLANFKLMLEEVEYDQKCIDIYLKKVSDYKVRVIHSRDEWTKKKLDRAKQAVDGWMRAKAGLFQKGHMVNSPLLGSLYV